MAQGKGGDKSGEIPDLDLDLEGSPGAPSPPAAPAKPAPARMSPFANPQAAVPISKAAQSQRRPAVRQNLPPPELIPMDPEPAQPFQPTVPAADRSAAPNATAPLADEGAPGAPGTAPLVGGTFEADLDMPAPAPRAAPAQTVQQSGAPGSTAPIAPGADPSEYFGAGTFDPSFFEEQSVQAAGGSAAQSPMDYFGSGTFDDDDFDSFSQGSTVPVGVESQAPAVQRDDGGQQWPSGRSPEPHTLHVDDVEARLLADFGPAPSSWFLTPQYAYRVFMRQRALKPVLAEKQRTLADLEVRRDERLADMVRAVRDELEKDDSLRRMLEQVHHRERVVKERTDALSGTNAEYDDKVAQIDGHKSGMEGQLAQKRETEKQLAAVLATEEEPFKKASVHLKRIHIELRSLGQVAQNVAKSGGQLPADHTQKVQQWEAKGREVQAQVESLQAKVDAARAPVLAARKEIQTLERGLRDLDAQRRGLDTEFQKQMGARSQGVEEATAALREAFAEAGRALLATRGAVKVDDAIIEGIREADAQVLHACLDVQKHLRAIDSQDRDAVKQGMIVAGVAVGVVLLFVIVLIAS